MKLATDTAVVLVFINFWAAVYVRMASIEAVLRCRTGIYGMDKGVVFFFNLIVDNSVGLWVGIQFAGEWPAETLRFNLSLFHSKSLLCASREHTPN